MRKHVKAEIEEYVTGTLRLRALREFEQHVAECRACAKAVRDAEHAQGYLEWLRPDEAPPAPGPDFYYKVQRSIRQKTASTDWMGGLVALFRGSRFAYPLLLLFLGLLLTAWTTHLQSDWSEAGIFGIPPARFSRMIATDADRAHSRDLVMVSLVDEN